MQERLRVFVLKPNEDWVVDVIGREFEERTGHQVVSRPQDADVIWLLGSWCWTSIDPAILAEKIVICSVHHIVPEKFDVLAFMLRDKFVDAYFVYTHETAATIRRLSKRPIARVAHWIDPDKWFSTDRDEARRRLNLDEKDFVVGSFQRDTEGRDLISPKMEKGPDIFCDLIERMSRERDVTVLLGGWRREYVLGRLNSAGIKHKFIKLPPQETVRDMYAACDLYACTSRVEGGPLCILEAAIMRVPIVSTRVGMAPDILHESQIIDPARWDLRIPSKEAIHFSHSRAEERSPRSLIIAYDDIISKVHSPLQ